MLDDISHTSADHVRHGCQHCRVVFGCSSENGTQIASQSFALSGGVCPPVGADTDCGTILTISDNNAITITRTGQGPYDQIEDTLIGVVNNSSHPLRALGLSSSLPIFGFDGDGIDAFGIPGNPFDFTGYGGPNAFFTDFGPSRTSGTVNFVTPIPPGGTGFFSLEEDLSTATSCQDIVNNSLTHATSGTTMTAEFTPQVSGMTTDEAARDCGFARFNWIQKFALLPDPSPYFAVNPAEPANPIHLTKASTPFNDPVQNGYTYNPAWNSFPYYFDPNSTDQDWSLSRWDNGSTLQFEDTPTDPCLAGGDSIGVPGCDGANAKLGEVIGFATHLVGMLADGSPVDLGIGFGWVDDHNGRSGGIAGTTANLHPVDPGSGTGGITVTSETMVTRYVYQGLTVTAINGTPVVLDSTSPSVTASASPSTLWPPNGKLVSVTITGTLTDDTGGSGIDASSAAFAVTDEYGQVQPAGSITVAPDGTYSVVVALEASRLGGDADGRTYTLTVTARDLAGNAASATTTIVVPHDQRQ